MFVMACSMYMSMHAYIFIFASLDALFVLNKSSRHVLNIVSHITYILQINGYLCFAVYICLMFLDKSFNFYDYNFL
jgi:hypothetical protein